MPERWRDQLLRWLRVPHDPVPPVGAPGSLSVFRAARRFYTLRLLRWGIGQVGALLGIIASLVFLTNLERIFASPEDQARRPVARAAANPAPAPAASSAPAPANADAKDETTPATRKPKRRSGEERTRAAVQRAAERVPSWVWKVVLLFEWLGIALYVVQIPFTLALVRLDYELRWYMVTDRSLRIRSGLTTVNETTMSFANVQQVVVSQGPLQRLLGLADVRVQSAGGGGGEQHPPGSAGETLHTGVFHSVDNADAIRDLILARLRQFRETGLGDPDDHTTTAPAEPAGASVAEGDHALAAARELLAEARALRRSVG